MSMSATSNEILVNDVIKVIMNFKEWKEGDIIYDIYNEIESFNNLYQYLEPKYDLSEFENIDTDNDSLEDIKKVLSTQSIKYLDRLIKYLKHGGSGNNLLNLLLSPSDYEKYRKVIIDQYLSNSLCSPLPVLNSINESKESNKKNKKDLD